MIFTSTNDALDYGRTCSQQSIAWLRIQRAKLLIIADKLRRENEINWAIQAITQAQFHREALEAHMRKI